MLPPEEALILELSPGEQLLWAGRPRQGVRLRAQDALLIPFSLMWGGFAVFWEVSVLRSGAPLLFKLWGVPFVLVGVYVVIGRFFADAWGRARTAYGVTDQRVLILTHRPGRSVQSLPLDTLRELSLSEGRRGGTITFGSPGGPNSWLSGAGWPGTRRFAPPAFEQIPQARDVYELIRGTQRSTQSSALRVS
jgi:hypothetical protein